MFGNESDKNRAQNQIPCTFYSLCRFAIVYEYSLNNGKFAKFSPIPAGKNKKIRYE